jgi:aspartate kinase
VTPVVLKFGGSSVADAAAISRVISIVCRARDVHRSPLIVVVSAMSGVTDRLLALASAAERREPVDPAIEDLRARHEAAARALLPATRAEEFLAHLREHLDELRTLLTAAAVLREASPGAKDAIASVGELLSSRIVAAALEQSAGGAAWVDARRVIVTDATYMAAAPLAADTREAVAREVTPLLNDGMTVVLGGFVGATRQGVTTTLGRGGSDYSAAIVGAAAGANEIQIWTDVDGMLTADPRVIDSPQVVPHLSFGEASELAYFGAKVLHPSTILPAVERGIAVRILNSRRPGASGTLITERADARVRAIAAVACKRNVTMVEITSTRMLMAYGFLRRVFEVFERHRTPVDVVTTSEVSVSVTVDDASRLDDIVGELREFAGVSVERQMAILCAVGDGLSTDSRIAARAIGALSGFAVRMVSQAASRRNVTIVLSEADVGTAMARLHEEFFTVAAST